MLKNYSIRNIICGLTVLSAIAVYGQSRRVPVPKSSIPPTQRAGSFIDVNATTDPESNYNIEQLVRNVLILGNTTCTNVNVSNVVVSPSLPASNSNRTWGFYNKGTTNFPFSKGIVLSTGYAQKAGNNAITGILSDGFSTSGDADLANALGISNSDLKDGTYIQFDFVPFSTEISFRYIFASEEYTGTYPCSFTDGFALLLKKVGDPNYTNLAVLPGGAGPVSVTNIHPAISNSTGGQACAAVNASYFAGYNNTGIETNFNGRTVPLTATATVVPGETYRFKMVLADYDDQQYDSAVFLEAGSFNLGINILDQSGTSLPSSIQVCDNDIPTLTASVQIPNTTFQWLHNGTPIPGATSSSYTPTQSGLYTVQVTFPGSTCTETASIQIEVTATPIVQNATLSACNTGGSATFDLTSAQTSISTTPGATFSYYATLADATAGNANTITVPTAHTINANQTIYVRVSNGSCYSIAELNLVIAPAMSALVATPPSLTCNQTTATLDASGSIVPTGATIEWTTVGGNIVSGVNTLTPTIDAPGTYTLTISGNYPPDLTCSTTATVTVVGDSNAPIATLTASSLTICAGESVTLTASGGASYNWQGLPGNGNTQVVSPTTTTTYAVSAVGANGCVSASPTTITIEVTQPISAQNATLTKCYSPNNQNYDLTESESQITTQAGVTFTYYVNQADALAGNTNFIANPTSYSSNGNQTIYVVVASGNCRNVVTLQLAMTPAINAEIAAPASLTCTSTQITLDASASTVPVGSTINWVASNGGNIVSGGGTLNPTVSSAGTYTLTIINSFQPSGLTCSSTVTVNVTSDTTPPNVTVTAPAPRICEGESITLTASGGVSYNWVGLTGNGSTQTVSPTTTTTYTVYAVGANGCVSTTPATITIQVAPPTAAVTANKLKICKGETVTLTASGGITYNWIGLTGNGAIQTVSPTTTTTYTVYALGGNGCSSVDPAIITIEVVPEITSVLENVLGCVGEWVTLDAGYNPDYTYQWSTGETTPTINVNVAGTYTVTISNGTCTKTFSAEVINPPLPHIFNVTYDNHTMVVMVANPNNQIFEYSINGGVTWQYSNTFTGLEDNINYTIWVRVKEANCHTSLDFFTFMMPNLITPNNDGINDIVDFSGIANYKDFRASIFDKYGAEIFRANSSNPKWDGTIKGSRLASETYWYMVKWRNPASDEPESRSGWILLKNN